MRKRQTGGRPDGPGEALQVKSTPDESNPLLAESCASVAVVLADLTPHPLVVLDAAHCIRTFNTAMESLLGVSRDEAIGRSFEEVCASAEPPEAARTLVDEVLEGRRQGGRSLARLPGGLNVTLSWRWQRVQWEGGRAPVGVVHSWVEQPPTLATFDDDIHYEISTREQDFGTIRGVWSSMPDARALVGQRCYEAIGRRSEICPECPAQNRARRAPATIVPLPGEERSYSVVTVQALGEHTARVGSRRISSALLNDLIAARVEDVAERHSLSARERQVLRALISGQSGDDIAEEFGISPRTVKFHQANVLAKLGADSRVDLLRLVF